MEFHEIDENLPEIPKFRYFRFKDVNRLSKNKKRRVLGNPNKGMRIVHGRLIWYLRNLNIPLPSAKGGVLGSSPIRNLEHHRQDYFPRCPFNRFFYLLDIRDAYRSIDSGKLVDILLDQTVGLKRADVESFLSKYCLSNVGGLIVGAPASPDLFNLYCEFVLDRELRELCKKYHITYTRYLDDITFSASRPIGTKKRKAIRQVILNSSFEINHRKAEVYDLHKGDVVINGVGIRRNGETYLPRHALRELRGLLHSFLEGKPINPHVIRGKWAMFVHLTHNLYDPTRTESGVIDQYHDFLMKLRDEKASPEM